MMGSEVEKPRIGFRARARKHLTSFIHSKSPNKELGVSKGASNDGSGIISNDDSFKYAREEELASGSFRRGSRESTEFDPLKRWDPADFRSPQTSCTLEEASSPWPEEFLCPISKALMADPVIVDSGTTYERQNVTTFLQLRHRGCLKTGETLERLILTKNSALKKAIDNWCDAHQVPRPVAPDAQTARATVERVCEGDDDTRSANPTTTSDLQVSWDTASSSDSSGGGNSRSSAAAAGTVRPYYGCNRSRSQPTPEASPVHVSTTDDLRHPSEWQSSRERLLEERQRHTWSGDKPRKFAGPSYKVEAAVAMGWTSASSTGKYGHPSSVLKNLTDLSSADAHQGRGGGVPLPLTTTPSAFNDGSGGLPADMDDLGEAVVSNLIQKLQHRHPLEQEQAAVEIRRLTKVTAQNRLALCEAEIFEVLLPLMQSRYSSVQINAVAAIMNLTLEKENKLKVARAGAIPFLIDVLKSGHVEAQEHAAGAIFSLALNDDNKMAIGVLGAIPPLIHVLRTGKHGARRDAAMALYHLSFSQMNRTKLIKAGGVGIFLGIARDERSDVVSRALLILCNIAAMHDGRVALAELSAVKVMVDLLTRKEQGGAELGHEKEESRTNWAEVREHAAAALLQLSNHNTRFKSQALQAGALDGLQRLLEDSTPRAREKATALLTILRGAPGPDRSVEDNASLYRRTYLRTNRGGVGDNKADSAQF